MTTTIQFSSLWHRFLLTACLAVVSSITFLDCVGEASIINGYSASRHDRFSSGGYGGSPVVNPSFFLSGYDFSGVGRVGALPLTMISPIHFVASEHNDATSGTVTFVNQDNVIKTYTIQSGSTMSVVDPAFPGMITDLVVGRLTSAIPAADKIAYYPTFSYSSLSEFDNAELLVYGKQHHVGRNELDGDEHVLSTGTPPNNFYHVDVSGSIGLASTFDYAPATGYSPDESRFEAGDSGHPTFIRVGSQLGLAGLHWAVGSFEGDGIHANFDTFIPYYQSQINSEMAGSGYSLQTISLTVPEPSSILLLFIAGIPCIFSRRTRSTS